MIPLGLAASASAIDTAIQKKHFGSGTNAMIISHEEMKDITKIVKYLEELALLI